MGAARTIGWKLDRRDRAALLQRFVPAYGQVVADHVTLQHKAPADVPLPPARQGQVVGWADDGRGVQALVVAIDGTTDRPDGSTYHITWSIGAGRNAVESNTVIRDFGWASTDAPLAIVLEPAAFG